MFHSPNTLINSFTPRLCENPETESIASTKRIKLMTPGFLGCSFFFFLSEGFPAALLLLDVRTDVDIVRAILLLRKEHDNLVNLQRLRSSMMTSESMRVLARGFFFFALSHIPVIALCPTFLQMPVQHGLITLVDWEGQRQISHGPMSAEVRPKIYGDLGIKTQLLLLSSSSNGHPSQSPRLRRSDMIGHIMAVSD